MMMMNTNDVPLLFQLQGSIEIIVTLLIILIVNNDVQVDEVKRRNIERRNNMPIIERR